MKRLKKFEEYVLNTSWITECAYFNSVARGDYDKLSDYDIGVFVTKNKLKSVRKNWRKLASLIGRIKFGYALSEEDFKVFVGDDYKKIDLEILPEPIRPPIPSDKVMKIIKDSKGQLRKLKDKSKRLKSPKGLVLKDEFKKKMIMLREDLLFASKQYARKEYFYVLNVLEGNSWAVLSLLARMQGLHDYDIMKKPATKISQKELDYYLSSKTTSLKKKDVKKAILILWDFMKYTQKKYEILVKNKLNLECNDSEILKIIKERLK
ncbi:MAG: hypothetical protein JW791_04635 [Nanoarchaeota archaeon]|nr:hypothetical protein [Nanoarchaeota archaeon]